MQYIYIYILHILAKAADLDAKEQEAWRKRVATGIVQAAWGANDAAVDHVFINI